MSLADLIQDRQFWLEFINEYENLPVLWKATHPHFASKKYRDQALLSLTKKVRTRWPGANVEFIKQRISNFRRTFLNEYEKVKQAQDSNNIYVPNLYYYNHLKFLKDYDNESSSDNAEQPKSSAPKTVSTQKIMFCNEYIQEKEKRLQFYERSSFKAESEYDEEKPTKRIRFMPTPSSNVLANIVLENENYDLPPAPDEELTETEEKPDPNFSIVEVVPDSPSPSPSPTTCGAAESEHVLHTTKEEFEDIARRVATHFSKMDPEQCLYAEKLIFDICISGRLKRLTSRTTICDP